MTTQKARLKTPTNPYSGSEFVMEEHEKYCEYMSLTRLRRSYGKDEAPSSSRRVHWTHHADPNPGEATPGNSDGTPHLEKPGQSARASSTVHFPRAVNYALTTLLFAVVLGLVLAYGEETDLLRDNPLASSHLFLSLRRYLRSSEHPSPRLRRQVNTVVRDGLASQIGPRDYALAADGASIVSRLTSGPASLPGSSETHPALVLLRDNLHGGRCWAILGNQAQVSIRTPERIRLGSVTVDHVPQEVAEDPNQAPRRMRLWGAVETAKFIVVTITVSNTIAFGLNWLEYMVLGFPGLL